MANETFQTIQYLKENYVARVNLNRPEIHNAFNDTMLTELMQVFGEIKHDDSVRVVVLTGNGKSFCAGADLNWMKKMVNYSYEQNIADANRVSDCMYLLYSLQKPTIARVNGAAIGGGMGLLAACDIAIAQENAVLSLSEVKIGLVPACISPYVLKRAGENKCRELFLTGERLAAQRGLEAGLINQVVPMAGLDEAVDHRIKQLLSNGPMAMAACKELLEKVPAMSLEQARPYTAHVIAAMRVGDEGQEGMNAFLKKRRPAWRVEG